MKVAHLLQNSMTDPVKAVSIKKLTGDGLYTPLFTPDGIDGIVDGIVVGANVGGASTQTASDAKEMEDTVHTVETTFPAGQPQVTKTKEKTMSSQLKSQLLHLNWTRQLSLVWLVAPGSGPNSPDDPEDERPSLLGLANSNSPSNISLSANTLTL